MRPMRNMGCLRPAASAALVFAAVALSAMPGCQAELAQPAPAATPVSGYELDPCAEKLDNLCERLFRYYALQRRLPGTLAELSSPVAGAAAASPARQGDAAASPATAPTPTGALTCPKIGLSYVYDPAGIELTGWDGRLLVYDAQPCHNGSRYGIVIGPVRPGQPLHLRTERIREAAIMWPPHAP